MSNVWIAQSTVARDRPTEHAQTNFSLVEQAPSHGPQIEITVKLFSE
jgi:hypothetical protein